MKTHKILYIITKSNFGGAQRYVFDLATHLPEDHEAVVALGGTGGKGAEPGLLKTRLDAAGVRTVFMPSFVRDMSLWNDARTLWALIRLVWREHPHVLHVTSSKAGGLGVVAGRICFVRRIIFTSHGLTYDEAWRPAWQRALIYCFTWLTIFLSTRTIQISPETYERAHAMPLVGRKVRFVQNGIELPPLYAREDARAKLLPDSSKSVQVFPWIGTIAEYHPNKNLGLLIEAIAIMRHQGKPVQLVLVGDEGDGTAREHLEWLARERKVGEYVHCTGYVPDAARYLQAFDIFTLPSQKEGLPYVLIEAGLAELPVVVSNIPGNTAVVTDRETGLVVEQSPADLAAAFTQLLEDPALAKRYARALHQRTDERFSVARMLRDTLAVYQ